MTSSSNTKPKFKIGDVLEPKLQGGGFEKATVIAIDKASYHFKIMNGVAIVPLSADANYQLYQGKRKKK